MEQPPAWPSIINMHPKALRACSQCRLARRRCKGSGYNPGCMRCEDRELDCDLEIVSSSFVGVAPKYAQEVNPLAIPHSTVKSHTTIAADSGSRTTHITKGFSDQADGSGMGMGSDSTASADPCGVVMGAQHSRPTPGSQKGMYVDKRRSHGHVPPSHPRSMDDNMHIQRYLSADDISTRQQSEDQTYRTRSSTLDSLHNDNGDRRGLDEILQQAHVISDQAQTWFPDRFTQQPQGYDPSLRQQYYEVPVLHQYRQYGSQAQPKPQFHQQAPTQWSDFELWFQLGQPEPCSKK